MGSRMDRSGAANPGCGRLSAGAPAVRWFEGPPERRLQARLPAPRFLAVLLLLGFTGNTQTQVSPESFQISVNVDLVVLHPTVRDRKGGFVSDLRERDFEVYEDRVRQAIRLFRNEDLPVTVGLVVDHSGSMRPKLTSVLAAARTFVRSSNPADQMFVVNFNEKV